MKKLIVVLIMCNIHIGSSQSTESILLKAEEKIDALNCVSYRSIHSSSVAGDTVLFYRYTSAFDVTSNPDDVIFGSRFRASFKDSSKIELDYHNYIQVRYNWEKKTLRLDTINPRSESISLSAPVLYQLKSLIRYSLAHRESVDCSMQVYKDSTQLFFLIRSEVRSVVK